MTRRQTQRRNDRLDAVAAVLNARKPKPVPPFMEPSPESGRAEPNEHVAAGLDRMRRFARASTHPDLHQLDYHKKLTDHQTHELNALTEAAGGFAPETVEFARHTATGFGRWVPGDLASTGDHLQVGFSKGSTPSGSGRRPPVDTKSVKKWAASRGYDVDESAPRVLLVTLPPRKPFAPHDPGVKQAWKSSEEARVKTNLADNYARFGPLGRPNLSLPPDDPAKVAADAATLHGIAAAHHDVVADHAADLHDWHPQSSEWETEHRAAAAAHRAESDRLYRLSQGHVNG